MRYLGLNAGYGFGKSNTDTIIGDAMAGTPLVATSTSGKLTGMSYGAQAGFNWQSGPWVAGIEADIQNSRQPGRTTTLDCAGATCNAGARCVRIRCAGECENGTEAGVVRDAARPARRDADAGIP